MRGQCSSRPVRASLAGSLMSPAAGPSPVLPLAWTLGVAALLLGPVPAPLASTAQEVFGGLPFDKLVHVALFAGLAFAWWSWSARGRGTITQRPLQLRPRPGRLVLGALLVAYGGALELIQPFFARDAEWGDWAADAVGVVLVLVLFRRRSPLTPKRGVEYRRSS